MVAAEFLWYDWKVKQPSQHSLHTRYILMSLCMSAGATRGDGATEQERARGELGRRHVRLEPHRTRTPRTHHAHMTTWPHYHMTSQKTHIHNSPKKQHVYVKYQRHQWQFVRVLPCVNILLGLSEIARRLDVRLASVCALYLHLCSVHLGYYSVTKVLEGLRR